MANPNNGQSRKFQISLSAVFVSATVFAIGFALFRVTPPLSLFNLIALFVIGSSPGVLFGYARNRWGGAIIGGTVTGIVLILGLFLLATFELLPEREPPPLPKFP